MSLSAYLPQDRLRAISRGETLPDRTAGSALLADISGFTPLTEGLRRTFGPRQGAEELTRHLNAVFSFHVQTLAKVRQTLGETAFRSAWEEGGRWSLEEAVAFVLEDRLGRGPSNPDPA